MTFGMMNPKNKQYKFVLLFLFFLITLPALAVDVKNTDTVNLNLTDLLHMFSQSKQSEVDFDEEKYAFYLDVPIKSSGHLKFSAPNKLDKFILKPEKVSQKIVGETLTINDGKKTHIIDLNDHPEFSVILRSIISVLSGNLQALKKDFKVTFESETSGWVLTLKPHDSFTSSFVDSIQMYGKKNIFNKMIVKEPNNDYSVTHLHNHR